MRPIHESIVERFAAEAIRRGADLLDIEYKDGYEEVVAAKSGVGHGIARFRSSSPEAVMLREELRRIAKRKHRITVDGSQYELRRGRVPSAAAPRLSPRCPSVPDHSLALLARGCALRALGRHTAMPPRGRSRGR
jgi:hypothetical protein